MKTQKLVILENFNNFNYFLAKLTSLKNTYFSYKEYKSKFLSSYKFRREFMLYADIQSEKEIYYLDYLNLISTLSYNEIFPEVEYRKTALFGKVEDRLVNIICKSKKSLDCDFNYFKEHLTNLFLTKFYKDFSMYASKMKLLPTKLVEDQFLDNIVENVKIYCDEILCLLDQDLEIFFESLKCSIFYLSLIAKENSVQDRTPFLFEIAKKVIDRIICIAESDPPKYGDLFFSIEKIITSLLQSFTNDNISAVKKLDVCEYFLTNGDMKRLENLIIIQKQEFSLMVYYRMMVEYFSADPNLSYLKDLVNIENLNTYYLEMNELIHFKMNNIQYDMVHIFSSFIKPANFENEVDKERYKKWVLSRFFLMKMYRAGYVNYDDKAIKNYPSSEIYEFYESYLEECLVVLKKQCEISKKILFGLKFKDEGKFKIMKQYLEIIFHALLGEFLNFFMSIKRDYAYDNYTEKFVNLNIDFAIQLYTAGFGHIIKGDPNGFAQFCSNLSNLYLMCLPKDEPAKLAIYLFISEAEKQINVINKILDFTDKNSVRLFNQFYLDGFFNMEKDLITEENYEKCKEMKKFDFLMSIIKKYNKRQKNSDFSRYRTLIEDRFLGLVNKICKIYFQGLDCFLLEIIERNWKIDEKTSFVGFLTKPVNISNEFAEIACLKPCRLLKNCFLFIKSFALYKDYTNIRNFGQQILYLIVKDYFPTLVINEKIVDINKVIDSKENSNLLFLNMFKQKIFLKLCQYYKTDSYYTNPILFREIENFDIIDIAHSNINFYLNLSSKILVEVKTEKHSLNKIDEEIKNILKTFYFRNIFVQFCCNDFVLMSTGTYVFKIGFFDHIYNNIDKILKYFDKSFEIFHYFKINSEFNDFATIFLKIKVNSFSKVMNNFKKYKLFYFSFCSMISKIS